MSKKHALIPGGKILFCGLLFLADAAVYGWGGPGMGIAQPKNYTSRSGEYSIFIEPEDRWGKGAAKYRFLRNGEVVWAGENPYTLREVAVTDDGHVAGFAYRTESKPADSSDNSIGGPEDPYEYMHIVILNNSGEEVLNEVSKRIRPPFHSNPPVPNHPYIIEFLVDGPNDRVIARVAARGTEWWVYGIRDGKSVTKTDVQQPIAGEDKTVRHLSTTAIAGTPLLLTHWYTQDREHKSKQVGGLFALVDADFKPVWTFDAPNDYTSLNLLKNAFMGRGGNDFFEKHPAVLRADEPRRFDVRLFADNKRVSFKVNTTGENIFEVRELGRIEYDEDATPVVSQTAAQKQLPYLGELKLGSSPIADSPFKDLWSFTFGADGLIYFLKKPAQGVSELSIADTSGAIRGERAFESGQIDWSEARRNKDGRFFVMRSKEKVETQGYETSHWIVELASGKESQLSTDAGVSVRGLAWFDDGGRAQIEYSIQRSALIEYLRSYDSEGNLKWSLGGSGMDDERLGIGPQDVCVTTDQRLILLSMSSVRIYERDGKLIKKIDLQEGFRKEGRSKYLGYIHEIVADEDAGFVIANSENPPLVVRYDAKGERRSLWSPRHADNRTFNIVGGIRVAPDGRLWTSDGQSIMRLTDNGVVDLVLGPKPEPERLDKVIAFATDFKDRMYAAAHGTGAVHVFDPDGKRLHVCKPNPTDLAGTVSETFIAVNDAGEVYLEKPATQHFMPPDTYLRFSASGERLNEITFEPPIRVSEFSSLGWAFQPKTNFRCGMSGIKGDDRLILVDPPGKIIHEIRHRPNRKWFSGRNELAMAPDGSIAVLDQDFWSKPSIFELDLFTSSGNPIRTIRIPGEGTQCNGVAYDGRQAVIACKEEVWVIDVQSDKLDRYSLTQPGAAERGWSAHIRPGSEELMLFDRASRKIHRFQLPQSVTVAPKIETPEEVAPDPSEAKIKADWVVEYQQVVSLLPDKSSCTVYQRRVENGSEILSSERVAALPENEREGLETIDMTTCGIRFDSPRVFARMLDIAAAEGLKEIDSQNVLDIGCCDLRSVQALARLGANVVQAQAGFNLTSMCNDWEDVGGMAGPNGQSGHLEVMRFGAFDPEASKGKVPEGHHLITVRNLVHKIPENDYFGSEPWVQSGIAFKKEDFMARLFELLAPGGLLLIYNVNVEPAITDNAFSQTDWESSGFKVLAFDRDDRGAALGIGLELGWDGKSSPLDQTIRAKYSLFKRP